MKNKKHLWAPWRMSYITESRKNMKCIFCAKLKESDRKALIIERRETCFSMLNIYPYNNGHLMAAPNRHVGRLELLTQKELLELINLVADSQKILRKKMKPDGFNIGVNAGRAAGAGVVDHIHFHIVPRWNGDTNFMPVTGKTKVMPQMLEDTFRILRNV